MLVWIYKTVKKLPILSQVYIVAIVFIHSAKGKHLVFCLVIRSKLRDCYCKVPSFEGRLELVMGSFTLMFSMQQA